MAHSKYKRGTEPLADTNQDLGPFKGGRAFNLSVDERDFTNQACAELVWLTTRSITSFMSRLCSYAVSCSSCRKAWSTSWWPDPRAHGLDAVALVVEDAVSALRCSPAPPSALTALADGLSPHVGVTSTEHDRASDQGSCLSTDRDGRSTANQLCAGGCCERRLRLHRPMRKAPATRPRLPVVGAQILQQRMLQFR